MHRGPRLCRTGFHAASAEVALAFVYHDLIPLMGDRTAAAGFDADTALNAVLFTPFHLNAAFDAQVVLLGFQAVVLTSGDAELKLVVFFLCSHTI